MDEVRETPSANPSADEADEQSLVELIREYSLLLEDKALLKKQTEDNDAAVKAKKEELMEAMRQADIPAITTGGFNYALSFKTAYSKKSDEDLKKANLDYFTVLREEGLGDIIVERVDSKTLQSTVSHYVEEHEELSPGLAGILNTYDYTDLSRTKAKVQKTRRKGGKKT